MIAILVVPITLIVHGVYPEPGNDIGNFIAKLSLFLSVVTLLTLSAGLHPLLCLWESVGWISFRLICH